MKIYALIILVTFTVFENASADWRNDVKINYWKRINSTINPAMANIRNAANSKGTAAARQCQESARLELKGISQSGFNDVSSCVRSASTSGIAHVCSQQVASRVFEESLQAQRNANDCIKNA